MSENNEVADAAQRFAEAYAALGIAPGDGVSHVVFEVHFDITDEVFQAVVTPAENDNVNVTMRALDGDADA